MKLTERQKMMAVSAHAGNDLRPLGECSNGGEGEASAAWWREALNGAPKACLACIAGFIETEVAANYNPGWPIGKLVRWLDSL